MMPNKDPVKRREASLRACKRWRAKLKATKIAAELTIIESRPKWLSKDLSWAAGMFEGEGTLTISKTGYGCTRPIVCLTNTDETIPHFFNDRWPGQLGWHQPKKGNARPALTWALNARTPIAIFLMDMAPYWKTPRVTEKARLLMADIDARRHAAKDNMYRADCHARKQQMAKLNRRGKNHPEKLPPLLGFHEEKK